MGNTRVIYSDATTAEAGNVLKSCGYLESNEGGLFTRPGSPVRVYVVWGKSLYFPEILSRLDFTPRIQIHFKCRENHPQMEELPLSTVSGLRGNSPDVRVRIFNVDVSAEIPC